jgi:hypothetical protein
MDKKHERVKPVGTIVIKIDGDDNTVQVKKNPFTSNTLTLFEKNHPKLRFELELRIVSISKEKQIEIVLEGWKDLMEDVRCLSLIYVKYDLSGNKLNEVFIPKSQGAALYAISYVGFDMVRLKDGKVGFIFNDNVANSESVYPEKVKSAIGTVLFKSNVVLVKFGQDSAPVKRVLWNNNDVKGIYVGKKEYVDGVLTFKLKNKTQLSINKITLNE